METCWVTLVPKQSGTNVLLMQGQDELLRARLPPLEKVRHAQAVTRLLEALSLWLDTRLCVALSAADTVHSFRLQLTDELGAGARSVFYAGEPVATGIRQGRRLRGVGGFGEARQLWLGASAGGEP
jgi:hypothetical protein